MLAGNIHTREAGTHKGLGTSKGEYCVPYQKLPAAEFI